MQDPFSRTHPNAAKDYTAAVIGCGRIGCGFDDDAKRQYVATHAKAYTRVPGVKLTALVDGDETKLKQYSSRYGVKGYSSLEKLLAEQPVDIVSLCTWTSSHYSLAQQAIAGGVKAIFCEKPLAESLDRGQALVQLCKAKNVLLMVDHQRRFDLFHQELQHHVSSGGIGEIQNANFRYSGGIANSGSHVFDLIRFFLGDAEWVSAFASAQLSPNADDPNFEGWVKFKSGALCAIQACDVKAHVIFEFDIVGKKGRVRLTHSGFAVDYYAVGDSPRFSGYQELLPATRPIMINPRPEFMLHAIQHLVDCLKGKSQPLSTGEDGLGALELICAFHESARQNGGRIQLPLEKSDVIIS